MYQLMNTCIELVCIILPFIVIINDLKIFESIAQHLKFT
jgi:hypothetical protein